MTCDSSRLVSVRQEESEYCDGSKSLTGPGHRLGSPCENVRELYVVEYLRKMVSSIKVAHQSGGG